MNRLFRHVLCACFLAYAAMCAGGEYHQQFCAARGTNVLQNRRIHTAGLLDPSNTSLKVTNILTTLQGVRAGGDLAGLRLGMTMEEVIGVWGKPPQYIWSWCFGGPRLCYVDTSAIFDPLTNRLIRVRIELLPHAHERASRAVTMEEAVRFLGEPTARTPNGLSYSSAREKLRLYFADNRRLFWVQLERDQTD